MWLAVGKTNAEIGLILQISPRTVAKHLQAVFERLGVERRTAAALRAFEALHDSDIETRRTPSAVIDPALSRCSDRREHR